MKLRTLLGAGSLLAAASLSLSAAVQVADEQGKVKVSIDGQPFTEYCYTGAPHVYYYPLIGPGGARMTRDWPMKDTPGEAHDHPHHRSLWYAHGLVNGIDFWTEPESWAKNKPSPLPLGKIVHEKFLELQGGPEEGIVKSLNRWEAPDGTVPLTGTETLRVYSRPATERLFDFEITLTAGAAEVTMGDTKEGTMALRIAESMRLEQANKKVGAGHIVNSEGDRDQAVWGKHAAWVDYTGPVDGQQLGIAIFDHPKNPRFPTRWHARDYGLFAANPFCEKEMDKSQPEHAGDFKIPAGQSVTFRYRFYLHQGDTAQAEVKEHFAAFAK